MKIAIHHSSSGFSKDWISYCTEKGIEFKLVNCYSSDIVSQISDCDALMWHVHHLNPKDYLFAKQLIFSIEQSGKSVFPDFNTLWHFDDKLGQKYLLEAIDAPLAKSWVFFDRNDALKWLETAKLPIVAKLRNGAGSSHVRLLYNKSETGKYIIKAFKSGISSYNKLEDLRENYRRLKPARKELIEFVKSVRRFFVSTRYSRIRGSEIGYVYFQEYVKGNDFDIRIVTIGSKAFGIKRLVRNDDFRASGSGSIIYEPDMIDPSCVKIAFETSEKLRSQCVAYDFVFDENKRPRILEISFGYAHEAYFPCPGYWDRTMVWHEEKFNSTHWMVDELVNSINYTHDYSN